MKSVIRNLCLASMVMIAISLTGCVKFKQVMTVMPDGSGKIDLSIGMSEQLIAMAKQQGENPFKEMDPKKLSESSKGIVAFSKPTQKTEGGYTYLSFSAYFEDANAVELGGPDDGADPSKFAYTRDGKSATLTIDNSMLLSAVRDYEPMAEEEKAFAAQMLAGMLFSESYVLPGAFEDIKGVEAEDNVATIEMDSDNMLNGTGPITDLEGVEKLVFKIAEVKEDEAAMKAFKAELEAAKLIWAEMQKEAE